MLPWGKFPREAFAPGGYERQKLVVRRGFVGDALSAFHALVDDDVPPVLSDVEVDGPHLCAAVGCSVPRKFRVDVEGGEAVGAMVPCRSFGMRVHVLSAIGATEGLVLHDEWHWVFLSGLRVRIVFERRAVFADSFYDSAP